MGYTVYIKGIAGEVRGKTWKFDTTNVAIVGRDKNGANILIPETENTSTVSRYQCQFEVSPPHIRVSDYGSKNGTYVDGKKIGQRAENVDVYEARKQSYPSKELKNGSCVGMGSEGKKIVFQIQMTDDGYDDVYAKLDQEMGRDEEVVADEQKVREIKAEEEKGKQRIARLKDVKELGHGGFARVLMVEDIDTHERYAVKEMLPAAAANPQQQAWFTREASMAIQLRHPNVVATYGLSKVGDTIRILMEYCNAGSLDDFVTRCGGKLETKVATGVMLQLLDALDYVHNAKVAAVTVEGKARLVNGLVHRDVKPENILLTKDEKQGHTVIKLSDLGLTKAFELAGQTGATLSSNNVMSVYFVSKKQVMDYRYAKPDVDVWAAAAVYYYMLAGTPVRNFNQKKHPVKIIMEPDSRIPLKKANPAVPAKLANVIDEVLAEEDTKVYPNTTSAKEFRNRILDALN